MVSMKTVAIYNQKGGAGRTTLAAHLAFRTQAQGISTVAVSLDRQGDLMSLLTREHRKLREAPHVEHREHLTIIYSPESVPELPAAALAVYDLPATPEAALLVKPDLWLIPLGDSRIQLELLARYLPELAGSGASILIVPWAVKLRGEQIFSTVRDVVGRFPNVTLSDHVVSESLAIARANDGLRPVWDSPPEAESPGAQELARLCDGVIALLGLAPVP